MILSRECEYALEGLMVLARQPAGKAMLIQEIADARGLPPGFLARIFQKLRRHDLVGSLRGAVRGYRLSRAPREITLVQVVEAIEGPNFFERCIYRHRPCDERDACGLHTAWLPARARLRSEMERVTLSHVVGPGRHRGRRARARRTKGSAT